MEDEIVNKMHNISIDNAVYHEDFLMPPAPVESNSTISIEPIKPNRSTRIRNPPKKLNM